MSCVRSVCCLEQGLCVMSCVRSVCYVLGKVCELCLV